VNDVLSAESLELIQRFDVIFKALTPISMVVMKEDTWSTWGSQLSGVARLFEQALEHCLHPYAERFVLHPAGSPMLLEAV
jgi:hypothetical protein